MVYSYQSVVALKVFVLLGHIIKEMLYISVIEYLLKEKILPDFVKLKFSTLNFFIRSFIKEHPKFFKMFQTILKLLVGPHYHIEGLLIFLLPVYEMLQPSPRSLDIAPGALFAFMPNEFIPLWVVKIHLLLLLEHNLELRV